MIKKSLLLSISLLFSVGSFAFANQAAIADTEKNIYYMEQIYQSIAEKYDQKELDKYTEAISKKINVYIYSSLLYKEKATETEAIEEEINNLLTYLLTKTDADEAYAIASMLFMIQWSKLVTKIALELKTKEEIENLQTATYEINDLVQRIFLNPMNKRLEEIEQEL